MNLKWKRKIRQLNGSDRIIGIPKPIDIFQPGEKVELILLPNKEQIIIQKIVKNDERPLQGVSILEI